MATETADTAEMVVSGITVQVVRKNIKNLHLAAYPPDGRVRIAVPLHVSDDAVRLAVASKLGWIRRQQQRFATQARQSERELVNGESHYVQGTRYRLRVVETAGSPRVEVKGSATLWMTVRPGSTVEQRGAVLERWHRERLRVQIAELIAKWEPVIGVTVSEFGIKKMKTRWGTCNTSASRIWINLELAKKSPTCLEYIVVHEMVHLLERLHNDRFRELMNHFMPQWRLHRDELNRAPLSHESWGY
jgi:predicted metal-dependent hydrolase